MRRSLLFKQAFSYAIGWTDERCGGPGQNRMREARHRTEVQSKGFELERMREGDIKKVDDVVGDNAVFLAADCILITHIP